MGLLRKYSGNPGLLTALKVAAGPSGQAPTGQYGGGASLFGSASLAGEFVSPQVALQLSAVWSACCILGKSLGMMPCNMSEQDGEFVVPVPKHNLQFFLGLEPNPEMSAMDWKMSQTASLALWGNSYSRIVRLPSGKIAGMWPMPAQLVSTQRNRSTGYLEYLYTPINGGRETYRPKDVLHIRTLSWDGINGISPVTQLRNALGLALALERYGSRFFANGAIPGIVLEYPGELGDEAKRNLEASWRALYGGADRSNGVAVLEEGMKATPVGVDPQKAQSVESRKFQLLEVARIWQIPPHMLGDLERATFSNIEQQSLEFVTYTLLPWMKLWEGAISRSLLEPEEKGKVFAMFDPKELLRGDIASRYAAYAIGRQWGWLTVNRILALEGMPGIGTAGDVLLEPLNMIEVGGDRDAQTNSAAPADRNGNGSKPKPPKPAAFRAPKKMKSYEEYLEWREAA